MRLTPSRLTLARRRLGFTLVRVSELTDLSVQSLSSYENGHKVPTPEHVRLLAEKLAVPVSFLCAPDIEEVSVEMASFRALSKMTARQRDGALGNGTIGRLISEAVDRRFSLPAPMVPTLEGYEPEAAAAVVRARWGLGELPISNTIHMVEAHGVRVFALPQEHRAVDAFSFYWEGTPFIFLNTTRSGERGRFDVCHELGHLVLHCGPNRLQGKAAEAEANAFASAMLMPRASVLSHGLVDATVDRILAKKTIWKVAAMALTHRLRNLTLLTDWGYRNACVTLSRMGYRSGEPGGIPYESSQLLGKVFRALRDEGQPVAQLATEVGITPEELGRYVFGLTMTGHVGGHTGGGGPRADLSLVAAPQPVKGRLRTRS